MDFATWRRLAQRVAHHAARPEVAGVVVTHGTDTLEETAYFLARVVAVAKPVVLTGAMRPATSREADGPRNLADAIAVAAAGGAGRRGRGLRRRAAFGPRRAQGPLVAARCVLVRRRRAARPHRGRKARSDARRGRRRAPWASSVLPRGGRALAVGGDRRQRGRRRWPRWSLRWSTPASTAWSSPPPATARSIASSPRCSSRRRCRRGIPVLRATRCLDGGVAAKDEPSAFASAGDLTPVKARVELVLQLLRARRPGGSRVRLDDVERDLDVAAGGVRVRADLVRRVDDLLRLLPCPCRGCGP